MKRNISGMVIGFAVMGFALLSLTSCACIPHAYHTKTASLLSLNKHIAPDTRQVLLVWDTSFLFFKSAKVYAMEKSGLTWRQAMGPLVAVAGRNGFAPPGEKREGDGRTPSGLYRLETAFGYAEFIDTKMPYRQATENDLWIDDPDAPDYNRWVRKSNTRAASYEKMRRNDDLYKYGLVIEYNTDPVLKNYGSAIFLHVWAGAGSATAGCVAVSEEDILKILGWLNPAARPAILINPDPI